MKILDFHLNGWDNKSAIFTFSNGEIKSGVITTHFPEEPNNYYLVELSKLSEFKKHMDEAKYNEMKKYCTLVNIEEILMIENL